MTTGAGYTMGVALVALTALIVGAALAPAERVAVWWAAALAVIVQVPLGWWVVRSVGGASLLRVWGLGIVSRFALLALAAWLVAPGARLPLAAHVFALAAILFLLLMVEAVVLSARARRIEAK